MSQQKITIRIKTWNDYCEKSYNKVTATMEYRTSRKLGRT